MRPTQDIWKLVCAKLAGHFRYYGVTDNFAGLSRYRDAVTRLLFKWLNRRSQRLSLTWVQFRRMLERHPLPRPRIHVNLIPFYAK